MLPPLGSAAFDQCRKCRSGMQLPEKYKENFEVNLRSLTNNNFYFIGVFDPKRLSIIVSWASFALERGCAAVLSLSYKILWQNILYNELPILYSL